MSDSKHTNYKRLGASLSRIADRVLTQDDLAKQIIIQKGNTYQAFDKYLIEETPFGWQVLSDTFDTPLLFNTAKVALAWCIAYNVGRAELAANMLWLDGRVAAKQFDIDILTNTLENADPLTNRGILLARLSEDINSRQSYKKQLAKCLQTTKYIKLKGTNNELSRFDKTSGRKRNR